MKSVLGMLSFGILSLFFVYATSCSKSSSDSTNAAASCTHIENTTETSTTNTLGCALLTRDTSSCEASRTSQGLSGFWLKFSCKVTLTVSGSNVVIAANGYPDNKSNYFSSSDECYEAFSATGRRANPNSIVEQNISMTVPMNPSTTTASNMSLGVVGVALNGVAISATPQLLETASMTKSPHSINAKGTLRILESTTTTLNLPASPIRDRSLLGFCEMDFLFMVETKLMGALRLSTPTEDTQVRPLTALLRSTITTFICRQVDPTPRIF